MNRARAHPNCRNRPRLSKHSQKRSRPRGCHAQQDRPPAKGSTSWQLTRGGRIEARPGPVVCERRAVGTTLKDQSRASRCGLLLASQGCSAQSDEEPKHRLTCHQARAYPLGARACDRKASRSAALPRLREMRSLRAAVLFYRRVATSAPAAPTP